MLRIKPSIYIGLAVGSLSVIVGLLQAQSKEGLNAVQIGGASIVFGSIAGFAAEALNKSAPGSERSDVSDKPSTGQSVEINPTVFSGIFNLPDEALEKAASAVALHEVAVGGASVAEATEFIRATTQRPTLPVSVASNPAPVMAQPFAYSSSIEDDFAEAVPMPPPAPEPYEPEWEEDLWGDTTAPNPPKQQEGEYYIDGFEL